MAGIKALRKIQLGRETTAGTAVAATTRWRGLGTILNEASIKFPEEDVGKLSKSNRSYKDKDGASISFESVPATFEQTPHLYEAALATATAAQDGSGSGYVYQYDVPTTQGGTIKTYTIEGGDNEQAEEMEYAFVEEINMSGNAGEAWMVSANWRGRQVTKTTFTAEASAPLPDVEEMLFSKTKLYIDDADGTSGTTQISNTLLSGNITINAGQAAVYTADGNTYFSFTKQTGTDIKLDVTFEHNSDSVSEKDNWLAETARLIQLKCEGSAFTTSGTTYEKKTFIANLPGKWESFDKIGESDGNDILAGTFRVAYDADAGHAGQFIFVNDLNALP